MRFLRYPAATGGAPRPNPQGGYSMQPQDLGKRLFTFAVIADSHLNQDELDCNSPFPVNKLANRRMRHVVHDLNRRDVAFVVHLGDLIHPVPAVKEPRVSTPRSGS